MSLTFFNVRRKEAAAAEKTKAEDANAEQDKAAAAEKPKTAKRNSKK